MSYESSELTLRPDPDWPQSLKDELAESAGNGCVGNQLVSETERVRVWTIKLAPGERLGFHRHVLNYFWTVLTDGRARSHYYDGRTVEANYIAGETKHLSFAAGESMTHDLENIGNRELLFTTVEFLDGANPPLPVPARVRSYAAMQDHSKMPMNAK